MNTTFEAFLYSILIVLFIGFIGLFIYSIYSYIEETNKKKEDQDKNKVDWSLAGIIITSVLLVSLFIIIRIKVVKVSTKSKGIKKFSEKLIRDFNENRYSDKILGGYDTTNDNTPLKNDTNDNTPLKNGTKDNTPLNNVNEKTPLINKFPEFPKLTYDE